MLSVARVMIQKQVEIVTDLLDARIPGAAVAEVARGALIQQDFGAEVRLDRGGLEVVVHMVAVRAILVQGGNGQDLGFRLRRHGSALQPHGIIVRRGENARRRQPRRQRFPAFRCCLQRRTAKQKRISARESFRRCAVVGQTDGKGKPPGRAPYKVAAAVVFVRIAEHAQKAGEKCGARDRRIRIKLCRRCPFGNAVCISIADIGARPCRQIVKRHLRVAVQRRVEVKIHLAVRRRRTRHQMQRVQCRRGIISRGCRST